MSKLALSNKSRFFQIREITIQEVTMVQLKPEDDEDRVKLKKKLASTTLHQESKELILSLLNLPKKVLADFEVIKSCPVSPNNYRSLLIHQEASSDIILTLKLPAGEDVIKVDTLLPTFELYKKFELMSALRLFTFHVSTDYDARAATRKYNSNKQMGLI